MTVTVASQGARAAAARPGYDRQSKHAKMMFGDLMALDPRWRREMYREIDQRDWDALLRVAKHELGTEYGLWVDDPVGFVEDLLGEATWSKQRAVLRSLVAYKRTAVPSAFGTGKTHIAARATLWRSLVFPFGSSLTVTTATRFRQVQRQLWPHVGQVAKAAGLPVSVDQTQMHAVNDDGQRVDLAYGFSAPPHDEAAVQGIHAPRLFIVVDEAGGIAHTIGKAMRGLLTGSDSRMLLIGNPPTDDEGSWFEGVCNEAGVGVVRISALSSPSITGERTLPCTCPLQHEHGLEEHLVDQEWVDGAIADHGEDAAFVIAKVHAKFPKGGPSRTIPSDWVDLVRESPEPEGPQYHRISDLIPTDRESHRVAEGAWVRLGVDVAADGGDELVISRAVGDLVTVRHTSSGRTNTNSVDVAGKVLEHIREAELLRRALGTKARVRVKIDGIGVGWGVASTLIAWGTEGLHDAEIVPVIVSENTYRDEDEGSTLRPYRKRDEMWLTGRALVQPRQDTGRGALRLRIDDRTAAQLSTPAYGTNSGGRTVIEAKASLKKRGLNSPDRAESVLLAIYEPLLKPDERGHFGLIGDW